MKKQKEHRSSKKKLYIILAALVAIVIILSTMGGEDNKEAETEPAQETESIQEQAKTESQEQAEPETEKEPEKSSAAEKPENDNPLMNADVQVGDVMNGTKTEKIGEWAEIRISKEVLKNVTQEQYAEFCESVVKDSGYNWFTITCEDGTGIQFAGSVYTVATYGKLDNEGCITETTGTIMSESDGAYSYTEVE